MTRHVMLYARQVDGVEDIVTILAEQATVAMVDFKVLNTPRAAGWLLTL